MNSADSELNQRRLIWINALKSGDLTQIDGALLKKFEGRPSFCCLGVARKILPGGDEWINECQPNDARDGDTEYVLVDDEMGMSRKMRYYLMSMNDGMFVMLQQDYPTPVTYFTRESLIHSSNHDDKMLRNTNDKRSFEFIARFLEIAWALTPTSTVKNARLPNIR